MPWLPLNIMADCIHCGKTVGKGGRHIAHMAHYKCSVLVQAEVERRRAAMLTDITTIRELRKELNDGRN